MAPEPANTLTVFDHFLRIWAVLGPMLAAGLAAWWNRKNEIENREFIQAREDEIEKRRVKQQNQDKTIELKKKEITEIKKSLLSFVSFAVECHNMKITNSLKTITGLDFTLVPQIIEEQTKRIRLLNDSFNELWLLSPPKELLENTQKLLNFVTNTPYEKYQDHSLHQQLSQEFSNVKTEVLESAKTYLAKENSNILTSLEK